MIPHDSCPTGQPPGIELVTYPLENIQDLLDMPQLPPFQNILDEVINPLARFNGPAILVLDDYHTITNALIHEMLAYFLEHQPHQAHLVIITRSDPPFPLARLRARRQMVEVRASDLRFTEEEASHFFHQSMQLMLEEKDPLSARTAHGRNRQFVCNSQHYLKPAKSKRICRNIPRQPPLCVV